MSGKRGREKREGAGDRKRGNRERNTVRGKRKRKKKT